MTHPPLKPLTNRGPSGQFELPADSWYHIAPIGNFPHESGVIQVVDAESVTAMASAFVPGEELLVDFDHESWSSDRRTTAAGWVQNLVARANGLFALIRWSKAGAEAVQGGEFKFLSPVWTAADCESLGEGRVRPLRLSDAGLTNRPNLRGLTALANRDLNASIDGVITTADGASAQFMNAVREIQSSREWSFQRSWEAAKSEHPALYANSLREQPITNRADKETLIPSHTWPGGVNPYVRFNGIVKSHAAVQRIDYERAYEACKLSHPSEYAQMLAEYERDKKRGTWSARKSGRTL